MWRLCLVALSHARNRLTPLCMRAPIQIIMVGIGARTINAWLFESRAKCCKQVTFA
jgi:hypothetical protein